MASAQVLTDNANQSTPLSYTDWRDQTFDDYFGGKIESFTDGLQAIPQGFGYLFGSGRYSRKKYNEYLKGFDVTPTSDERISSAELSTMDDRAFAQYLTEYAHKLGQDSEATKYQTAMKDLQAAGLNPRLLLEGGSVQANGVSASSAGRTYEGKSQTDSFSSSAIIVGLIAAVAKLLSK